MRSNKPVDTWGKTPGKPWGKINKLEERRGEEGEERVVPFEAFSVDVEIQDDEFGVDATASVKVHK